MKIKVADDDEVLRFYPFAEVTIEGVSDGEPTPTATVTVPPEDNVTVPPGEEAEEEAEETPTEPGFEALFAIGGLLAVAYLVLRRK